MTGLYILTIKILEAKTNLTVGFKMGYFLFVFLSFNLG